MTTKRAGAEADYWSRVVRRLSNGPKPSWCVGSWLGMGAVKRQAGVFVADVQMWETFAVLVAMQVACAWEQACGLVAVA